jgi:BirA family biotin operon repressor/biotin-[acetyl-CoA-carboxylase] ligase
MYDLAAYEEELAGTIFAGKLHYFPITGSTNVDAVEAARNDAPHGSVFLTNEQSGGRGRGDHSWHSAPGDGLYVSILLRPQIPMQRLALLPLIAALATSEAIRTASGLTADLRWPNDLLIGPRKVVGMMVESKIEATPAGGSVAFAVIGIGINVHQQTFPPDLAAIATSLDLETGRTISRHALLVSLLKSLEHEAQGLLAPMANVTIPRRIAAASSWIRGKQVEVHGPQACAGVTEGLDEHGFLLVRTDHGLVTVQTGGIRAAKPQKD